jgi:hypothetical protein
VHRSGTGAAPVPVPVPVPLPATEATRSILNAFAPVEGFSAALHRSEAPHTCMLTSTARGVGLLQWDNASFAGIQDAKQYATYVAKGDNRKKNYVEKPKTTRAKSVWDEV